jgi:hypothetical protein
VAGRSGDGAGAGHLVGTACAYFQGRGFLRADQVFWTAHAFGRYRVTLGEGLLPFKAVFNRIGVKPAPDWRDARRVLEEIAADVSVRTQPLDDETAGVLYTCWQMLASALHDGQATASDLAALRDLDVMVDANRMLNSPSRMFFEDRAGLAKRFARLHPNVVPIPQGISRAMEAAGVRRLGDLVSTQLLECADRADFSAVGARIRERASALARVLETVLERDAGDALRRVEELAVERTPRLVIRYDLAALGREWTSEPESPKAKYLEAERVLVVEAPDDAIPWAAVAREIAVVAAPDREPGRVAPALSGVLQARPAECTDLSRVGPLFTRHRPSPWALQRWVRREVRAV